jgi:hypothetical protein
MTEGIAFIATGGEMTEKALDSSRRVAELTDRPICLVTDRDVSPSHIDHVISVDDPSHSLWDKVENFHRPPYDRCLYLDADTYVCEASAIDDLFRLLERFDIATAMDSARRLEKHVDADESPSVAAPRSFPEPNTGVVVYDADRCAELFAEWRDTYRTHCEFETGINDQGAFHEAVYQSDVQFGTFQPEYNFRLPIPHYVRQPVQILHGHANNFREIETQINTAIQSGDVLYYPISVNPYSESTRIDPAIDPGRSERFIKTLTHTISEYGIRRTVACFLLGGVGPQTWICSVPWACPVYQTTWCRWNVPWPRLLG